MYCEEGGGSQVAQQRWGARGLPATSPSCKTADNPLMACERAKLVNRLTISLVHGFRQLGSAHAHTERGPWQHTRQRQGPFSLRHEYSAGPLRTSPDCRSCTGGCDDPRFCASGVFEQPVQFFKLKTGCAFQSEEEIRLYVRTRYPHTWRDHAFRTQHSDRCSYHSSETIAPPHCAHSMTQPVSCMGILRYCRTPVKIFIEQKAIKPDQFLLEGPVSKRA